MKLSTYFRSSLKDITISTIFWNLMLGILKVFEGDEFISTFKKNKSYEKSKLLHH